MAAYSGLRRQLDAELTRHSLSVQDFEVLLALAKAGDEGMRRIDLAQKVGLSASGVTRMLNRLEGSGWVQSKPCADDARTVYAVITAGGRKRLKESEPAHLAAVERMLGGLLDEDEIATLGELLERLAAGEDADCTAPDEAD